MTEKEILEAFIKAALETEPHEEDIRKRTAELAKPLYEGYLGFIDAGFSPEQAFKLLLTTRS